MSQVRTRFAPSPTGHLHLGGARTALFNALYAAHHGGSFVLRIEDTDRKRSADEFVQGILAGLEWLGIAHDEGPFFQSQRGDLYRARVEELLAGGHAYHCFCSPAQIEAKREAAQKEGRRATYDRSCRGLARTPAAGETPVVRFRAPEAGETVVEDLVRGPVRFDNAELDDLILVRSDGTPTFHLVVVTDDIDMGITHILRGEDHLTNTPRQVQIFRALGVQPPAYGHLPLIVGSDRARLSKRHGATAVDAYRDQGFLPDAVVNYLARLGWSHGDDEIFTREQLIEHFDVDGVGKAAAAFDMEKFMWVNAQHLRGLDDTALATAVAPYLEARGDRPPGAAALAPIVGLIKDRAKTLVELAEQAHCFVSDDVKYAPKAVAKFLGEADLGKLAALSQAFSSIAVWDHAAIEAAFAAVVSDLDIKLGALAQPTRVALTGGTTSPGIYEVCDVLGKDRTLARLEAVCRLAPDNALPLADAQS